MLAPGFLSIIELLCHEPVHHDIVAEASSHYEEMENFVGAEVFVFGIEDGQLQRIDDAAYGVNDAACQQPPKGGRGKGLHDFAESQNAHPAHGDVDDG